MAEEFGKRIGAFGQSVWKKAQDAYDVVSISTDVAAKKHDLSDVYAEIGKAYVAAHAHEDTQEFPELCAQARALEQEIDTLNSRILRAKGLVECPSCGEGSPAGAVFCAACGAKLPQQAEPQEPPADAGDDARVCKACGAQMQTADAFCANCGAKQEE